MKKITIALATLSTAAGLAFALDVIPNLVDPAPGYPVNDAGFAEIPVDDAPFTRTLRSAPLDEIAARGKHTGIYEGSPKVVANFDRYDDTFYSTLASRKIWHEGTSPDEHERGGDITWDIVPIPQYDPPDCDQAQPTGYDAEGCRIANSLYKDIEKTDPEKAKALRESVRRGRDVWFKGTFGNQDLNEIHLSRTIGKENMHYAEWMDTRTRPYRFTKWGMINDPDCKQGSEESYWVDVCQDPHSTGVLGYRKYFREPEMDDEGNVTFDPRSTPYQEGERENNRRFAIGHPCVQCHVSFDPTNPPKDPNQPEWENLMGLAGNQYVNQPLTGFLSGTPRTNFAVQAIGSARPGTVDTSINPNDFMNNPGTQNNITDFMNKRVFNHVMKDPFTGELKEAPSFHILKGAEDTVGDRLALLRVYINIGMCTEECWVPNFPYPGTFFGEKAAQKAMSIKQCSEECEAWNHADAKMGHLAQYIMTSGPTYLMNAKDVDGTSGADFIDTAKVPEGRKTYARECARCHSTKVPPESIKFDKDALEKFYEGHVFGAEEFWQFEFTKEERNSKEFKAKHMARDANGKTRPAQFAKDGFFGQDWLGNDNLTPFHEVGVNMCRAMHDNHDEGHIWEEFASETFRERPSVGSVPRRLSRMVPGLGGMELGETEIGGEGSGAGYYRNISLLSAWAIAPFLHNNSLGELTYLEDGTIDYTVKGRVQQYEIAMQRLLMSDDPNVEPHRPQKTTVTTHDMKLALREDGQGFIKLPVSKGTPVANFASSDPHNPTFQKCDDLIENKGHQFGVDLSADEKRALTEFLKMM